MNTLWSLLAVAVFAFTVFFNGEPSSGKHEPYMPAHQQAAAGDPVQMASLAPTKQRPYGNKARGEYPKKKKSYNDDFQYLNN